MIRSALSYLVLFLLLAGTWVSAQEIDCRPYRLVETTVTGPDKFKQGLLWEVSRAGTDPGYVFGTIHVDDEAILDLPDEVINSLRRSRHFVMETVPSPEETVMFSTSMFFTDGTRLDQLLPRDLFDRTTGILRNYDLTPEIVAAMKPWAAYVVMSYPADMGVVLDLKLMEIAEENGAAVSGLETLKEQMDIFNEMDLEDQARILADVVCHYDLVAADLKQMKSLYLKRDLAGLYIYGQRYSFEDDSVYDEMSERLVSDRNRLMAERIDRMLGKGAVFIAIGAMHLPGDDGVLNLLEQAGYRVRPVY